ncbi:MAG: hypothetical protein IJX17_03190 [Clostridia bacterium]|nr:hypothetical protein [Clostridia bacterium]
MADNLDINLTKERISEMEDRLYDVNKELKNLEQKKKEAHDDSVFGLFQMSSPALRSFGTYNYLTGVDEEESLDSRIKKLNKEKNRLEFDIDQEKFNLKMQIEEFQYKQRPEAKLIVTKDGIFIDGDERKFNLVSWAEHSINMYKNTYHNMMSSNEVLEYQVIKNGIPARVKGLNLPKATKENIAELDKLKIKGLEFDYVIIDDKLVVDKDVMTDAIRVCESLVGYFKEDITKVKSKYDNFTPTFIGKVFKSVGRKQKSKRDSNLQQSELHFQKQIETYQNKIKLYKNVKEKYFDPAVPIIEDFGKLRELAENSYYVKLFINEREDYEKNIENHTILKATSDNSISSSLSAVKYFLDTNGLKLNKESIYEAIYNSKYHQELATEIKNATGYKAPKKSLNVKAVESSEKGREF